VACSAKCGVRCQVCVSGVTFETRRRVLGEEHPDTLSSMNNLAFTLQGQGRNDKAVNLISECVRLRNQILGAEHPDTLDSSAALAEWQGGE
jgi:Tetratricopeptide repeat